MPYPLTITEIDTEIAALGSNPDYSSVLQIIPLPNPTIEGRIVKCLKVGNGSIPVLIIGGVHAREWAPPDSIIGFIIKLLQSHHSNTPFIDARFDWATSVQDTTDSTYTGAITFDRATILNVPTISRIMRKLSIYFIPCVNPDGRHFTLPPNPPANIVWRKNRRNLGAVVAPCGEIGVDINRNFPAGWDFEKYYDTATLNTATNLAVTSNPCLGSQNDKDVYHGTSAASEPETLNVKSIIDDNDIRYFLDIHSAARELYYPWGLNPNQTTDATKSFLNTALDRDIVTGLGGRQIDDPNTSNIQDKEFFPTIDLLRSHIRMGNFMHDKIKNQAGSNRHAKKRSDYAVKQSFTLYSAPGNSSDYAFSKQLDWNGTQAITNSKFPIYSFAMESGTVAEGGFHPLGNEFKKYRREIWCAIAALLARSALWSTRNLFP